MAQAQQLVANSHAQLKRMTGQRVLHDADLAAVVRFLMETRQQLMALARPIAADTSALDAVNFINGSVQDLDRAIAIYTQMRSDYMMVQQQRQTYRQQVQQANAMAMYNSTVQSQGRSLNAMHAPMPAPNNPLMGASSMPMTSMPMGTSPMGMPAMGATSMTSMTPGTAPMGSTPMSMMPTPAPMAPTSMTSMSPLPPPPPGLPATALAASTQAALAPIPGPPMAAIPAVTPHPRGPIHPTPNINLAPYRTDHRK